MQDSKPIPFDWWEFIRTHGSGWSGLGKDELRRRERHFTLDYSSLFYNSLPDVAKRALEVARRDLAGLATVEEVREAREDCENLAKSLRSKVEPEGVEIDCAPEDRRAFYGAYAAMIVLWLPGSDDNVEIEEVLEMFLFYCCKIEDHIDQLEPIFRCHFDPLKDKNS